MDRSGIPRANSRNYTCTRQCCSSHRSACHALTHIGGPHHGVTNVQGTYKGTYDSDTHHGRTYHWHSDDCTANDGAANNSSANNKGTHNGNPDNGSHGGSHVNANHHYDHDYNHNVGARDASSRLVPRTDDDG